MYADVAQPLYTLFIVFEWMNECEQPFQKLKNALISTLILRAPYWNKILNVHIDASTYVIGCILAMGKAFFITIQVHL